MATITLGIVAGAQNFTYVKTISAAHLVRFLNAYRKLYGQVPDGVPMEGQPQLYRDMTDVEVATKWSQGFFEGTKALVRSQEQADASKVASDAVTDITLT